MGLELAARVPAFRLLLITDRKLAGRPLPEVVQEALSAVAPGSVAIQLREKDLDTRPLLDLASALLPLCRARNAPLLVNDRIDIALALGLDGVHLPHA
jgi:thiamine-phosphate pyrophosphorylase